MPITSKQSKTRLMDYLGMCFGYDTIANGATISMPGFALVFGAVAADGTLYIPSIWASLWTAMS
jgi:hypothetical protein